MSQQTPVLNVVTPATGDLVTLEEMQTILRVSDDAEADFLQSRIDAAVEAVQLSTGKQLLPATYELSLPGFPCGEIEIPLPPLRSVDSIKYDDDSGDEQTLSPSLYTVLLGSPRIRGSVIPAYGLTWPTARRHGRAVRVTFTCGFADADAVPQCFKGQVQLLVSHWFFNRSAVACGSQTRSELAYDMLQGLNEIKEFF